MFANCQPLAAIFCMLCNMIEIRIKLDLMSNYQRRGNCEGASNIGFWLPIMEMLSIICIPINIAIIYLTGESSYANV